MKVQNHKPADMLDIQRWRLDAKNPLVCKVLTCFNMLGVWIVFKFVLNQFNPNSRNWWNLCKTYRTTRLPNAGVTINFHLQESTKGEKRALHFWFVKQQCSVHQNMGCMCIYIYICVLPQRPIEWIRSTSWPFCWDIYKIIYLSWRNLFFLMYCMHLYAKCIILSYLYHINSYHNFIATYLIPFTIEWISGYGPSRNTEPHSEKLWGGLTKAWQAGSSWNPPCNHFSAHVVFTSINSCIFFHD